MKICKEFGVAMSVFLLWYVLLDIQMDMLSLLVEDCKVCAYEPHLLPCGQKDCLINWLFDWLIDWIEFYTYRDYFRHVTAVDKKKVLSCQTCLKLETSPWFAVLSGELSNVIAKHDNPGILRTFLKFLSRITSLQ